MIFRFRVARSDEFRNLYQGEIPDKNSYQAD